MYITCTFGIDAPASALNNGQGSNNVARTKKLYRNGFNAPYASAQAFRFWMRQTMETQYKLAPSPVTKIFAGQKQQAYTAGDPVSYYDDDLFGFMHAVKNDEAQRPGPFVVSTLLGERSSITEDFGVMARQGSGGTKDDARFVLHGHELYSALLTGSFSVDMARVGVFNYAPDARYTEIRPSALANATPENGAHNDKANYLVTLSDDKRRERIAALLHSFVRLEGGAKQSLHYTDVRPVFFVAAIIDSGHAPFGRCLVGGEFRVDVFDQAVGMFKSQFQSAVHVGYLAGVLDGAADSAAQICATHGVECVTGDTYTVMDSLVGAIEGF
jgi:CRISPR-associated protein Cst2